MRRGLRLLGTALVVCGVGALAWAVVVWRWQDPFTALYTKIQQHRLAAQYDHLVAGYEAPRLQSAALAAVRLAIAQEARRYRLATHQGALHLGRNRLYQVHLAVASHDEMDHQIPRGSDRHEPRL